MSDRILVVGARTTDKYGLMQVNLNPVEGRITVNPKGFKQLTKSLDEVQSPKKEIPKQ